MHIIVCTFIMCEWSLLIMILNHPLEAGLHVPSTVKNMKSVMWPLFCENVDRLWLELIPLYSSKIRRPTNPT